MCVFHAGENINQITVIGVRKQLQFNLSFVDIMTHSPYFVVKLNSILIF